MRFLLVVCCAYLLQVIVCDYQLEINIISYNNSAGRLETSERCCDAGFSDVDGSCSLEDSCDIQFTFSVQNFNSMMTLSGQTKSFGTYDNRNMITFASCSTLMNGIQNPLTFVIPFDYWNDGVRFDVHVCLCFEVLILLAEIADVDQNTGTLEREIIMSSRSIAIISRPRAPYTTFSPTQTYFGPNSQTLKFQYRVLGTYGFNCTNSHPFPSCAPVTCKDSPCHNGGTCSEEKSFSCACKEEYTGETCNIFTPTNTSTPNTANRYIPTTVAAANELNCDVTVYAAVVSSIIVFILSSLLACTTGFVCGYVFRKRTYKNPIDLIEDTTHHSKTMDASVEYAIPVKQKGQGVLMKKNEAYNAAPSNNRAKDRNQEIDVKKNLAYGPISCNNNT